MDFYDVALWLEWPSYTFPLIEVVEAEDGIEAIEKVMHVYGLVNVIRAAVRMPGDSFIARYRHVMLTEGVLEGEAVTSMA